MIEPQFANRFGFVKAAASLGVQQLVKARQIGYDFQRHDGNKGNARRHHHKGRNTESPDRRQARVRPTGSERWNRLADDAWIERLKLSADGCWRIGQHAGAFDVLFDRSGRTSRCLPR
jgi:hypothetical protein